MNIAFRVDASVRMGLGHLMRCRTLAAALRERGAKVHFICREHPGNRIAQLMAERYQVTPLPAPPVVHTGDEDYAAWLGVTQAQDANETIAALTKEPTRYDWLIVDHYRLDADWERALRATVGRLLIIDDLANRRHDCDLLVDQNYAKNPSMRYHGLVSGQGQLRLGPRYALLRPEFAQIRQARAPRDGHVQRLFLFFGGTDLHNITSRALKALSHPALESLTVDLLIGPNNPHCDALVAQAAKRPNTTLHLPRPDLAELMAQADLAVAAGGTSIWERCCLGLPSVVISIAENQRTACEALGEDNLIVYAGHKDRFSVKNLQYTLQTLINDPEHLRKLSHSGRNIVDGRGTDRVIEALNAY